MKDCFGREIPNNLRIVVRRDVLAEALWEYGEDALAERVLTVSDDDLHQIQRLNVWHCVNDPEPDEGPRLTNGRISSRAVIEFFEGKARDTKRRRRRTRPEADGYAGPYLASLRAGEPLEYTPAEQGFYGWGAP